VLIDAYNDEQRQALRDDTFDAIADVEPGVTVHVVSQLANDSCEVEGMYHEPTGRIYVQEAGSARRTRFTALHELGHRRARKTLETARHLAGLPTARSRQFEEKVADAFAAGILIPDHVVDRILDGKQPTARHAAGLFDDPEVGGSREACCVKLAQNMSGNGYVLLAQGDMILFCAIVGTALRVARGTAQGGQHLIVSAANHGSSTSDHVTLTHRSGAGTPSYAGQAVAAGDYVFAVLTDATNLPWGGWRPPDTSTGDAPEIFCESCDEITEAWDRCENSHRVCGVCGWCECSKPRAKAPTMVCDICFVIKPLGLFDGDSNTCRDCL
jgi:hypothetical protein